MQSLVHATYRQTTIHVDTAHPTEFIDLTADIEGALAAAAVETGLVNVQTLHTTTGIVINEFDEPLFRDVAALLGRLAPQDGSYRHDDLTLRGANCALGEPPNGHSHCRALLLGPSVGINVVKGRLRLGCWQRILLIELDGPRRREVSVMIAGESTR